MIQKQGSTALKFNSSGIRFDRSMTENDPNNIEEFPGEEFPPEEQIPEIPSPIARKASFSGMIPAVVVIYAAWMVSYLNWNSITPDLFSLSLNSILHEHQYWRILSSLFMHANIQHFASNLLLLFVTGWFLYEYYGLLIFPAASLVCGMAANVTAVSVYGGDVRLVGASGMVYAMAGLWLVLYIRFDTGHKTGMRIFRACAFSLALLFPTTFSPEISYIAHAAGFIYGILSAVILGFFITVKK
jgi:rhomboid protease GluP